MGKSKFQENKDVCYLCGRYATDEHHIFNGAYRKRSDEDGMVVYLCRWCHDYLHKTPLQAKKLKSVAQIRWEEIYMKEHDCDITEARLSFLKRYGKNYGTDR